MDRSIIRTVHSDEDLMAQYVAGDSAAFEQIFARYAPLLTRLMLRELRVRDEAFDLVQQTFLHLHRARHDFDPRQKLKPWIFTIAINLKREYFRKSKRRRETALEDSGALEASEEPRGQNRSDAARDVERALLQLPPLYREVIQLHWLAGLSFAEIGKCVGATPTAAKVRAHRGYGMLRRLLDDAPEPAIGGDAGNSDEGSGI